MRMVALKLCTGEDVWVNAHLITSITSYNSTLTKIWFDRGHTWVVQGPAARIAWELSDEYHAYRQKEALAEFAE